MYDIVTAIKKINPNASVSCNNEDYNQITYLNDTAPISIEDIKAKQVELKTEYDAKQYQRDRVKNYPTIEEQLDMQYWDKVNSTNTWEQAINAVKTNYPKP